ncbi:MAG: helix-turn-helix transcriptional regulator [Candidatus Wallbacteria bacterium]|nr:helix-turn-helix transcriptional regulator [Candidatus Wallbacteria bacterium]
MLWDDVARRVSKTDFPERLAMLRKQRGLTQKALAAEIGVHFAHLRRYEAGGSQPTLEVLCNLARALRVSADLLLFGEENRGPVNEFRVQFEALAVLEPDERRVVRDVLDALLLKHDAKRWASA